MKPFRLLIYTALCMLALYACGVHEFPEEGVDPTTVHTRILLLPGADMTPFDLAEFSTRATDNREYDVRYQVEVYADDKYDQSLQFRRTLTYAEGYAGDVVLECDLHARNYRVMVWRDFVPAGTSDDCFYTTSDFTGIGMKGGYVGATDYKDAFSGQMVLDLTSYRCKFEAEHQVEMQLERPQAKIVLVTTDVIKYLDKLKLAGNKESANENNIITRVNDIEDLRVEVSYAGYFPMGFDISLNRPNNAAMDINFQSTPMPVSDNEACLAFDYILVNGEESAVNLEMVIRNEEGAVVNRVSGVNVPVKRNKITTVRDKFLTREFAPGIGIDSEFDGEINIVIP